MSDGDCNLTGHPKTISCYENCFTSFYVFFLNYSSYKNKTLFILPVSCNSWVFSQITTFTTDITCLLMVIESMMNGVANPNLPENFYYTLVGKLGQTF